MYRNFRFRIRCGAGHVAGFSLIEAQRVPGAPITLERGVTHDADFEQWAAGWSNPQAAPAPRDLDIDVFNEDDEPLASYHVRGCRVASYLSMPYMDETHAAAIRLITLANEGWDEVTSTVAASHHDQR